MRVEERLKVIYETIAPAITRNESAWKDYLKFGSQVYKHQFDNALLVYAQSPKSTMLATTPIWNKVGRYINKGEKGTAVCEYANAKLTLKYLFDISQSNGKTTPDMWVLDEEKAKALSDRLSFSHNINADGLNDCINQIVSNTLAESLDDNRHFCQSCQLCRINSVVSAQNFIIVIINWTNDWCGDFMCIAMPKSVTEIGKEVFCRCDFIIIYCYKNLIAYKYALKTV